MRAILSHADLLIKNLEAIESKMNQFIDLSEVGHTNREAAKRESEKGIIAFHPAHYWKEVTETHIKIQTELKRVYSEWKEQFDLLSQNAPESVLREIEEVHGFILSWIERIPRYMDCSVKPTLEENKRFFKDRTEVFHRFIASLSDAESSEIILIPDTNSLIICPELQEYSQVIDISNFTVIFVPTVLQELDSLKQRHSDRDFEKVNSVITRIKGFRLQGNLQTGVAVHQTITVKSIAKEPNFKRTLHWLDPVTNDDRIIATILELQREYLASKVVLVTNDINLQNKADVANIPSVEPPKIKNET